MAESVRRRRIRGGFAAATLGGCHEGAKVVSVGGMRTDSDNWDINSGVGSTALFVAAARALAARQPEPVAVDPLADVFLRAVGGEWAELIDGAPEQTSEHPLRGSEFGRNFTDYQGARTKYFDDYLLAACADGIRQVVILAAGLDSRAYRLPWPDGVVVYELDRAEVLDFKREVLDAAGHKPRADRVEVAVDLRGDWLSALRHNGFDAERPTAWLVEGLLIYVTPAAQDQLFETIVAASAPGSRAAIEQMEPLPDDAYATMRDADPVEGGGEWASLIYNEPRSDAAQWFPAHGWTATRTEVVDYLRAVGRPEAAEPSEAGFGTSLLNLVTVIAP